MKYKRVETKNGRVQYFVNGTMTSPKNIEAAILNQLEGNMELEITAPETEKKQEVKAEPSRADWVCFIDGEPAKFKKFLELQTVYLCDKHQHSLTTGEVVYEMRQKGLIE